VGGRDVLFRIETAKNVIGQESVECLLSLPEHGRMQKKRIRCPKRSAFGHVPGEWFGTQGKSRFMYRSWMKNQDIPDHEFQGKPI